MLCRLEDYIFFTVSDYSKFMWHQSLKLKNACVMTASLILLHPRRNCIVTASVVYPLLIIFHNDLNKRVYKYAKIKLSRTTD